MFKIALWAFNIWSLKKGYDLIQENAALKYENGCKDITIKTLAQQVSAEPPTVPDMNQN